jgi:hypothetical protein
LTPVWGIVTEPITGSLSNSEYKEFIPSSHVKFIEQTGTKVVPISYKLSKPDLLALLDQLSGVYFTGDSIEAPKDQ